MGVILNENLQKGSNCTELFPNMFYRKCMKFNPPPSPHPVKIEEKSVVGVGVGVEVGDIRPSLPTPLFFNLWLDKCRTKINQIK